MVWKRHCYPGSKTSLWLPVEVKLLSKTDFDVSFELEHILETRGKTHELSLVQHISELISISYIRQKESLGLGHAVSVTRELIGNEHFAVILADDVINAETPCVKQLLDVHAKTQSAVIAVTEVPPNRISSYGVVEVNLTENTVSDPHIYQVRSLVEKPAADRAPSNLAVVGRYVFPPEIFDSLSSTQPDLNGELQLTDAINKLAEIQPVYAYRFEGKRYDTGNKLGFLKATVEYALRRKGLGNDFREYLKDLKI